MRLSVIGALLVAASTVVGCGGPPTGTRMNVVLLVMDTTRADRCSFEGYERPTTPRLDEFAKDAVVFTDAWSPAGWTGPAHASLFTGLRPEHHGFDSGLRDFLGTEHVTLAERLRNAGWATACFSNNDIVSAEFGLVRGFEKQANEALYRDERRPYPYAKATHEAAASWAERTHSAGKPFFLFINDMEPHAPYTPPDDVAKQFVRGDPTPAETAEAHAYGFAANRIIDPSTVTAAALSPRKIALLSNLYDAEIATLDREIGALLDRLRKDDLLESTVVVIVGDHGENLGDHGFMDHHFSLHRAICHVPMLVRIPRALVGGAKVGGVARLEDVAPTILEACGLPPITDADGAPLTKNLGRRIAIATDGLDDVQRVRGPAGLAAIVPPVILAKLSASLRSVFDGSTQYVACAGGKDELYDVTTDPLERENIAAREPALLEKMRALLRDAR